MIIASQRMKREELPTEEGFYFVRTPGIITTVQLFYDSFGERNWASIGCEGADSDNLFLTWAIAVSGPIPTPNGEVWN